MKIDKQGLQQKLNQEQYHVLVEKGTEKPFSGKYDKHFKQGMYVCGACGTQLFESGRKYDAGCGWPSFDQAISGAVEFHDDNTLGMCRIEVACVNCGGHLGHVFPDGPQDTTGQRFCINSAALDFKAE